MKTKEELNTLREEVKTLNKKLSELTEEELAQVAGGMNATALQEKLLAAEVAAGKVLAADDLGKVYASEAEQIEAKRRAELLTSHASVAEKDSYK